jgi:hypothetical protein
MLEAQNNQELETKATQEQLKHQEYIPHTAVMGSDIETREKRENELNLDIKMIDDSFSVWEPKIAMKNQKNESFWIYKDGEYFGDIHSTNGDGSTSKYAEEVKTSKEDIWKNFITEKWLFLWLKDFYSQVKVTTSAKAEFSRMLHNIPPEQKDKIKNSTEELINNLLMSDNTTDIDIKAEIFKDGLLPWCIIAINWKEYNTSQLDQFIEGYKWKAVSIGRITSVFDWDFTSDLDRSRKIYKTERISLQVK